MGQSDVDALRQLNNMMLDNTRPLHLNRHQRRSLAARKRHRNKKKLAEPNLTQKSRED